MKETYPVKHAHLDGENEDTWSHRLDTTYAPRISDEIVTFHDVESDRSKFGEIVAIITPDHLRDNANGEALTNENSFYIVRYPETKEVGIATHVGDKLTAGMIIPADEKIYFGRIGDKSSDGIGAMGERQVLGLQALSGSSEKQFGNGVSRLHGALSLSPDGLLNISDGYEAVDQETRVVQDVGSENKTRATVAHESVRYMDQQDIITEATRKERERQADKRLADIFASPDMLDANGKSREQKITPESLEDAAGTLDAIQDKALKDLIKSYMTPEINSYEALITNIRTNPALRLDLGKYLINKARTSHNSAMSDRVQNRHNEKRPTHLGYAGPMKGDEYAALLAISMLDGTFISADSIKDPVIFVDRANDTVIEAGQHRLSALHLLDLSLKAPEHVKIKRVYQS